MEMNTLFAFDDSISSEGSQTNMNKHTAMALDQGMQAQVS
jgi:hypothetical protein